MNRSSVMQQLEEEAPKKDLRARFLLVALLLSLAIHAGFLWWARDYPVKTFSDSYYEEMVPRAFKVDRVEIDSRLLEDDPAPEAARTMNTPAPVDLPPEDVTAELPQTQHAPAKPGDIGLEKEPPPDIRRAAAEGAARLNAAAASALEDDLDAMREAMLAEDAASPAQPAIELAAGASARGGDAVPEGYSNLDELLSQSGGLSASQAPIFMPSDVLFGYDESFLRPEAVTSLEKLGELIRRNPRARFRIEGHTDSFGGTEYNARLSLARAESVKQWLAGTMAIDPSCIETRGLGSTRPLAPLGGTVEEQKLNRRVEIVILRTDAGE
ncbi:MAG: OmpA family protein [Chthoniobacterales bacterium]|nr:OmpA family protein [Chthoniobacterales bacterium]